MVKGPTFLIVGAAGCGTTSLYKYLNEHPNVYIPYKEIHFFDNAAHFSKDKVNYQPYLKKFKNNDPEIFQKGEATPIYCYLPEAIERIYEFDVNLKLIMLVRDPVWRAVSNYSMERQRQRDKLSLSKAIDLETKRHRIIHSYCRKGHYSEQLDTIHKFFPAKQVIVERLEDMAAQPQQTINRVCNFLEIPTFTTEFKTYLKGSYKIPDVEVIEKLSSYFRPYNQQLHQKYDIKISDWI